MAAVVTLTLGSTGCPPPPCEVTAPLARGDAWSFVSPASDTTSPPSEGAALCGADAIQQQAFDDDLAVEIDTRFGCGHATVEQGIRSPLQAGDEVLARIFYFSQTTFPAAEAEVGVVIGDEVILDARVPIPSTSGLLSPRVTLAQDHPAGTLARFHVGNHGDNSWNLVELSQIRLGACPADDDAP